MVGGEAGKHQINDSIGSEVIFQLGPNEPTVHCFDVFVFTEDRFSPVHERKTWQVRPKWTVNFLRSVANMNNGPTARPPMGQQEVGIGFKIGVVSLPPMAIIEPGLTIDED